MYSYRKLTHNNHSPRKQNKQTNLVVFARSSERARANKVHDFVFYDYCLTLLLCCYGWFLLSYLFQFVCRAYWISLGIWYSWFTHMHSAHKYTEHITHIPQPLVPSLVLTSNAFLQRPNGMFSRYSVRQHVEWSSVLKRLNRFVHGALLFIPVMRVQHSMHATVNGRAFVPVSLPLSLCVCVWSCLRWDE